MRRLRRIVLIAAAILAVFSAGFASAANPFTDIGGNTHANSIDAIYNAGITAGCVQGPTFYCPNDTVKRDQMASFLARTAGLSSGSTKNFPVVNARGQQQAYCALQAANPQSFSVGACATTLASLDLIGSGERSSIAIGSDGSPVLSYGAGAGGLRMARCANPACTAATTTTLDNTSMAGSYNAIAIGHDGLPVIAYYALTDLLVKHCQDYACDTYTTVAVDAANDVGQYLDLAIGPDGPVIAYYDNTSDDLKVVRCGNADCSESSADAIDVTGDVGRYASVAVDGAATIVSYWDVTNGDLKVARCAGDPCDLANANRETVDSTGFVGAFSSIAIGVDQRPIVSYEANGDLKVVHCNDVLCDTGGETFTIVEKADADETTGMDTSIAIGTNGMPVISYRKETFTDFVIRFVACRTRTCTNVSPSVEMAGSNGFFSTTTAVAIGIDGVPVVAYARNYDLSNMQQMVARIPG